jgi:hypothetical protein
MDKGASSEAHSCAVDKGLIRFCGAERFVAKDGNLPLPKETCTSSQLTPYFFVSFEVYLPLCVQ